MIIDSHCHLDQLDLTAYNGNLDAAINAAKVKGVEHILNVCIDMENFPAVLSIAEQYDHVTASVGLHPNEQGGHDPSIDELVKLATHEKVVAIGETGLDYYRSEGAVEWQRERFRRHIAAAKQLKKPLIIHTRQAREDTIKIMQEEKVADIGGVMHCFSETWEMAQQAIELGFYISFSGIVTFKNARELHEVAIKTPLENMLIETDAPYLAPVPYRGKSNEPAYVHYVAERIAELKQVPYEKVAQQTTDNFYQLFGVK